MKPLLIGMNSKQSKGRELYPLPDGGTGHRLWRMLHDRTGATMRDYCETFERRNLVRGEVFQHMAARARAYEMVCELKNSGRTIVLLGRSVSDAFDHALTYSQEGYWIEGTLPPILVHPLQAGGCTWRCIPHPRTRWYDDAKNREVISMLMEELYVKARGRQAA